MHTSRQAQLVYYLQVIGNADEALVLNAMQLNVTLIQSKLSLLCSSDEEELQSAVQGSLYPALPSKLCDRPYTVQVSWCH